jgi:hypothetical protein
MSALLLKATKQRTLREFGLVPVATKRSAAKWAQRFGWYQALG